MPKRAPLPAGTAGGRWLVAQRDLTERMANGDTAIVVLIYDPQEDLILGGGVGTSTADAVAKAIASLTARATAGPAMLACDARVLSAIQLQRARFDPPPKVTLAAADEFATADALFDDFLTRVPQLQAEEHREAVDILEQPARDFIRSRVWTRRADNEPLFLAASINGERINRILSVMGNAGETYGVCLLPDIEAFDKLMTAEDTTQPPSDMLSCLIDRRALRTTSMRSVELAARIVDGAPRPATGRDLQLLYVALLAAAAAPPVDTGGVEKGTISAPEFEADWAVVSAPPAADSAVSLSATRTGGGANRRSTAPVVRFGDLPRTVADSLRLPDDAPPAALIRKLPKDKGVPAVWLCYRKVVSARAMTRRIERGRYTGVEAEPMGDAVAVRLVGVSDPIELETVETDDPGLRAFLRDRRRHGGLHAVVVVSMSDDALHGIYMCVLRDEPTPDSPRTSAGPVRRRSRSRRSR